ASFSSRGVQGGRLFPNLCANGVSTDMARRDNEASNYIASGTSMASPMVCGAATLIRGYNRNLKSDETRAILLASTDASPGTGSGLNSTGPGAGYLQDDVAYAIAKDSSLHGRASLTNTTTSWTRNIAVKASQRIQIAIAWHRLNTSTTGTSWTNLNLQLRRGTTVLASSTTTSNLEEFIRYTPTATETLNIRVYLTGSVIGGSSQAFGWSTYGLATSVPGTYTTYGSGCGGTSGASSLVLPNGYASTSGNSANSYPFGWGHIRYMQVHDKSDFPGNTVIRGFQIRNRLNNAQNAMSIPLVLYVGHTASASTTLNTTFANNWKGASTLAFSGTLNVPSVAAQTNPTVWTVKIPFSTPFTYMPSEGNFLWEAQNSRTVTTTPNYFDAVSGSGAKGSRLYNSTSATATTGSLQSNYHVVMRLDGAPPVVAGAVVPKGYDATSGNSANSYPFGYYNLRYMQAHANTEFSGNMTIQGMAVRNRLNNAQIAQSRRMTIRVGYTSQNPRALNTTFASNWLSTPTTVFTGVLNTPAFPAQTNPKIWTLQVPYRTPFVYVPSRGHFLMEAQNSSTAGTSNFFDSVNSTTNPGSRLFNNTSSTAATGTLGAGYTVILQLQVTGSGSGVTLSNTGVPTINASFNINLSNASTNKIAILWLGGTQLNASLGAIAPGCSLYSSLDVLLGGVSTGASGSGTIPFGLPNNTSLIGTKFYNQYMVFDSGANTLGLTLSNGGAGMVGG
ncbi:MAG: S8 family serine peptidase, partial [Planctomycetes bacterium]|nr:S8 family serine peptidase [Planctomycetota bacterium]